MSRWHLLLSSPHSNMLRLYPCQTLSDYCTWLCLTDLIYLLVLAKWFALQLLFLPMEESSAVGDAKRVGILPFVKYHSIIHCIISFALTKLFSILLKINSIWTQWPPISFVPDMNNSAMFPKARAFTGTRHASSSSSFPLSICLKHISYKLVKTGVQPR